MATNHARHSHSPEVLKKRKNVEITLSADPIFPVVPELRIYKVWDGPVGPHPVAMFEVNIFTPAQFGAFIPWLSVWRGPLSALVHPNSTHIEGETLAERVVKDHTVRATWLGERIPLDTEPLMNL